MICCCGGCCCCNDNVSDKGTVVSVVADMVVVDCVKVATAALLYGGAKNCICINEMDNFGRCDCCVIITLGHVYSGNVDMDAVVVVVNAGVESETR